MKRNLLALQLLILAMVTACGREPSSEADQDKKSEQMMKGVTLVGRSSQLGSDKISGEERYVIAGVSKLVGDTWLFRATFQYGGRDYPIPIPVTIKWAGDTPVITLTDASIPGAGTYTARVLLYRDQYAGTWSGEKAGGQMFGKIVRNP